VKKTIGKICKITEENTLGEESLLDKKYFGRMESAFVESQNALLIEVTIDSFMKIKELLYEIGLKKDFLMIESILRRNFVLKKNSRL
jgi:hypothetical protein